MKRSTFAALLVAILAFYVGVEVAYAIRAPRIADEFLIAYTVRQFGSKLAYREFAPPKTVLAFYLLLPPLRFVRDAWNAMTAAKIELVLFNVAALALAFLAAGLVGIAFMRTHHAVPVLLLLATGGLCFHRIGSPPPSSPATDPGVGLFVTGIALLVAAAACEFALAPRRREPPRRTASSL